MIVFLQVVVIKTKNKVLLIVLGLTKLEMVLACDADAKARHLATATRANNDTEAILQNAFRNATLTDWATWTAIAAWW